MPLENPKSPVQHPHHSASGFSIPGRLPCLLAVVLGLFAHQGALAQTTTEGSALNQLTLSEGGYGGSAGPAFRLPPQNSRTYTADDVVFGVTQVTVVADAEVRVGGDVPGRCRCGWQRRLPARPGLGANTITVRATKTADPPETARNYTIRVTRLAETGSALRDPDARG